MAREHDRDYRWRIEIAAATAGTVTKYDLIDRPVNIKTFMWTFESTETNADNTLDYKLDYTVDGTNFTTVFDNVNPLGLADTAAALVNNVNKANAASSGTAGVDLTSTFDSEATVGSTYRIPAGATLRFATTTAGTGTLKAMDFVITGTSL